MLTHGFHRSHGWNYADIECACGWTARRGLAAGGDAAIEAAAALHMAAVENDARAERINREALGPLTWVGTFRFDSGGEADLYAVPRANRRPDADRP